jgi:hypothetical protein
MDTGGRYKVGLMSPVYIEVDGGSDGLGPQKAGDRETYLTIETTDSEDVGTIYKIPVKVPKKEALVFTGYAKAGYQRSDMKIRLHVPDKKPLEPPTEMPSLPLDPNSHLYVSLGSRLPDLQVALNAMIANEQQPGRVNFGPGGMGGQGFRFAGHESSLVHLPEFWYGYEGIDLLFLTTGDKDFLTSLLGAPERLRALADWVRRGGRLVVPVAWQNQDVLAKVLHAPVWQPPVPVVPPNNAGDAKKSALRRLPDIEAWARVQNKPFPSPGDPLVPVATLDPGQVPPGDWDVKSKSEDGRPLVAHVKYGLGQITYLAFSFDDAKGFANWDGRVDFLKGLVKNLAPAAGGVVGQNDFNMRGDPSASDLASNLLNMLDNFDVRVIPFAYVALFIVLYILIVGPLDFFLLKYVFKRLELTWITFPTVVLAVSVIAYFSAYAIKGNDLKINKVDVVDFDLRTGANAREAAPVQAYGQSFFTILSPRIQSYTIGLEPNPAWGFTPAPGQSQLSADLLTWMGRPDNTPWGMGRSGSQGFFRNPYWFVPEQSAAALEGVPIPVWTTKAFTASWTAPLASTPLKAALVYHHNDKATNRILSGTLQNNLPVELHDAWLMYDSHCYPLKQALPSSKEEGKVLEVALELSEKKDFSAWMSQAEPDATPRGVSFNPTTSMKQLLFYDMLINPNVLGNHTLRHLDLSWRVKPDTWQGGRDPRTREAVLYARVRFCTGGGDALQKDTQQPLPTRVWLGDIPAAGKTCPELLGFLSQDTYVRFLLPVRPAGD